MISVRLNRGRHTTASSDPAPDDDVDNPNLEVELDIPGGDDEHTLGEASCDAPNLTVH